MTRHWSLMLALLTVLCLACSCSGNPSKPNRKQKGSSS
jgi:hypothetical protein